MVDGEDVFVEKVSVLGCAWMEGVKVMWIVCIFTEQL